MAAEAVTGSGPGGSYLGSDMRAAYYGGTALTGNGQTIGILEFGGYAKSDVDLTFSKAGQTYNVPIQDILLDGATTGTGTNDGEQVLDIVQAIGMAPGLSQVRVYIGSGPDNANVLNSMVSENLAKVLSCSWSWRPADPSVDDPFFQEMAAQGQSFFTASGDSGAYYATISPYFYPQEDQYVTAVGGTHLTTNGAAGSWVSETVWNSQGDGSGGGISPDNISIPSWQAGLANTANGGSTTLRNSPDVAMEGDFDNFACENGSCGGGWAGTSFAAPRWAAFMALVNQQAVEAGNASTGGLGFINPTIYQLAQNSSTAADFHDITSGNNLTNNQPVWFSATPGYDLTTGWGSANSQQLINDLAGQQVPGFWLASNQSTINVTPGNSSTATLTITPAGGFSNNVTLTASNLPAGVMAAFSPNPATGPTQVTFTAASSATVSSQAVTITGTSGTLTASTNVTVAVHTPTFSIAASPSTIGINQGSTGTSTITVTPLYGFSDSVNLSVSGLPSGVTASFSPTSTTGSSTLTLTASSTANPGASTIVVTGTSGSITNSTNLSLSIHGPSFTLSATSTSVDIGQGSSGSTSVYITDLYGFMGNVNLAVSGLPAGVTATISPNPASTLATITFVASATAAPGQSAVTITGTSGSLTATTSINLGVHVPTFTLSGNTTVSLGQGSTGSSYVYINSQYGFNGSVSLSVSGLPAGVTAIWSANPTSSGSSALTFSASSTAKVGQYPITITGTSGLQTATTTMTLGVYVPTFTLSGSTSLTVGQGTSSTGYVYVTPQYGFTGSVNLTASGLPSGVTASFSPNPTTGSSTLTLQASSTATTGQYTVTIIGTSGSQTASMTMTVGVYVPTFTLSNYGGITVGQGTSSTGYVYVNAQYGFTGSVSLAVSGLPSGVTASFSPNPTTYSSTLTVAASSAAATGQYTVTVTGTSGTQTASTTLTLGIYKPTFAVSAGSVTIGQGTTSTDYVYVTPQYGFTGSVTLSTSGLPSGVTASFSPNPATGSTTMTLQASSTASLGQYTITLTGTSGTQTASSTFTVGVYTPAFTLSSSSPTIGQGTTSSAYVYVNSQYGFNGNVTLSVSGLPSGVTATFSPNPTTYSSTLTFTVPSTTPTGSTTLTVTGTSGSQVVTTTTVLSIVTPSFTMSSSVGSLQLNQGATGSGYVYVYGQNGFSGSVNLVATGLPSGTTATFSPNPTTSTSSGMTLAVGSSSPSGTYTVTITGTSGSATATTTFPLTINAPGYTLTAVPATINMYPGGSQKSTITPVAQYGFAGSIVYAVTGLPAGVTATVAPNPSSGVAVVTYTASAGATPASSSVTVTGSSGSLSATVPVTVNVLPPAAATTTAITVSSSGSTVSTVTAGTPVTLTAAVTAAAVPVTIGQIAFCEASVTCDVLHAVGIAQLTKAGSASVKFTPGPGNHSYKAVFAGTLNNVTSSSAGAALSVTASQHTMTGLAQSGSTGNYTLASTITGQGLVAPSGSVSFLDTTDGLTLGSATLGSGTTTLGTALVQSPAVSSGTLSIASGDFNGDGITDLVTGNSSTGTISILLGNGDGTFQNGATIGLGSSVTGVAVGDFNRDGVLDIAAVRSGSNSVAILLGNGDGTFTPANYSPVTGSSPNSIVTADFNQDGYLDLAVVNGYSNSVTVLLGNGDGTFTPAAAAPSTGSYPQALVAGDFNGDGLPDLAVVNNYYSGSVTILLGNGDGSFTSGATLSAGYEPTGLATADLNGDGKLDLVTSSQYYSNLLVFLGRGDGSFGSAATVTLAAASNSVAIADMNGDRRPDILATNSNNSSASLLLGNGDGTFASPVPVATGSNPYVSAIGDWNGDGVPDFATVNTGSNTLSVFITQLTQKATATATGISPVGTGQHTVTAKYSGDSSYGASTSSTVLLTAQAGVPVVTLTSMTPNPTAAQAIAVTASVGGSSGNVTPTGTVTIASGSYTSSAVLLSGGSAAFTIPAGSLPAGADKLTATYTPDPASASVYKTATGTVTIQVALATPGVTFTVPSQAPNSTQPFSVNVYMSGGTGAPTATGAVVLTGGSYTSSATPLNGGAASVNLPAGTLPVGQDAISIAYTPDTVSASIYAPATGSGSITVGKGTPSITWPSPPAITYGTALSGAQLNATASIAGNFMFAPAAGTVLAAGTQTLSVTFTPTDSANYSSSTSTVPLTVNKAPLTITAANASRVYGISNPAFTGTVSGAVNGDSFTETFATTASASSPAGTYTIVPSASGTAIGNYAATATNGTLTISQASTTTAFALSNSNLTFTGTVTSASGGTPSGTVNFYAGTSLIGTGTITNGTASYTAASFPAGDPVLSAVYSGDNNFAGSTSGSAAVLSSTPSSSSLSTTVSGTVQDSLVFTVASGYSGTLQLSCTGLPQYTSCSFSPGSLSFGSMNSASTTLTVSTGAVAGLSRPELPFGKSSTRVIYATFGLPGLLALTFAIRRRRWGAAWRTLTLVVVLGFAFGALAGCAGGSSTSTSNNNSSNQTPAGTYAFQVVATGQSGLTQTISLSLKVQ